MEPSPVTAPGQRPLRRPLSRSAPGQLRAIGLGLRSCSRAACSDPATATLVFSYDEQVARMVELLDEREPQTYDLCGRHADRTSPPRGWQITDTRPPAADAPRRLEDEDTVAVIAAALRGDDPRRVDVIDGGDGPAAPRRVTSAQPDAPVPVTAPIALDREDEDPLRAALEEVQRVVEPDLLDTTVLVGATVPLARRRRQGLPTPPAFPPPGDGPAAEPADDQDVDRPTLW